MLAEWALLLFLTRATDYDVHIIKMYHTQSECEEARIIMLSQRRPVPADAMENLVCIGKPVAMEPSGK
jgi:hypothetical protein